MLNGLRCASSHQTFNVRDVRDPRRCGSLLSFNIQHFTFNIQHLLSERGSRSRTKPRSVAKTTTGPQTAAPSQPDVGQGVPTRESAAISKPGCSRRPSKGDTPEPGVPARGADTRGCRRFTAGVHAESRWKNRVRNERTARAGWATREEESADPTGSRPGSAQARRSHAARARARSARRPASACRR